QCDIGHALIVTSAGCLPAGAAVGSRYAYADYSHREVLPMKVVQPGRPARAFLSFVTSALTLLSVVSSGVSPVFAQVLTPSVTAVTPDDGRVFLRGGVA